MAHEWMLDSGFWKLGCRRDDGGVGRPDSVFCILYSAGRTRRTFCILYSVFCILPAAYALRPDSVFCILYSAGGHVHVVHGGVGLV